MSGDLLLAVNAGSSTLKFSLHQVRVGDTVAKPLSQVLDFDPSAGIASVLDVLKAAIAPVLAAQSLSAPAAIVHRVVHGGERAEPALRVTDALLDELDTLAPLAPLHQPANLAGIRALRQAWPKAPAFACFDTGFHASLPLSEQRLPIPAWAHEQGIRRYGFHGLSYAAALHALAQLGGPAKGRVLMAHLGSGASLCLAVGGRSRATTMGFSALDGLPMGTRSGALDPGVLLHLLGQGMSLADLAHLLYRESGLLGLSGLSSDVRRLRASADPAALLALQIFTQRVVHEMAGLASRSQGIDALVFTGGIGERDAVLRAQVCEALAFMGVSLEPSRNAAADGSQAMRLSAEGVQPEVWCIPADEGSQAVRQAWPLLQESLA